MARKKNQERRPGTFGVVNYGLDKTFSKSYDVDKDQRKSKSYNSTTGRRVFKK